MCRKNESLNVLLEVGTCIFFSSIGSLLRAPSCACAVEFNSVNRELFLSGLSKFLILEFARVSESPVLFERGYHGERRRGLLPSDGSCHSLFVCRLS